MNKAKVKKIVKKYAEVVKDNNISFDGIYLYGSYSKDSYTESSDIDVAVIIDTSESKSSRLDTQMKLWRLIGAVDTRIEPMVIEKEDFEAKEPSIMGEQIKKFGVKVI